MVLNKIMNNPKIYIHKRHFKNFHGKFLSIADIDLERPSKNSDNYIEYTDISQLWHSTRETPQIKEYDDYVRILVKGDEIISMTTFTKNMDWDTFCWDWTIYQWAYLDDFLPKE